MQDDFDCFLLACSHGQWKVVQELVNRHGLDPHVVNEVRVRACVHMCMCSFKGNAYANCMQHLLYIQGCIMDI